MPSAPNGARFLRRRQTIVTALEALQRLTDLAFGALFLLTIVDFARMRDRIRFEIAWLFGSIAPTLLIQALANATGTVSPYVSTVSTVFLLSQPYALVRLLSQFRTFLASST